MKSYEVTDMVKADLIRRVRAAGSRTCAVWVGRKTVGGILTDEPAIVVGVEKKLPASKLAAEHAIPMTVKAGVFRKVATDVVELGGPITIQLAGKGGARVQGDPDPTHRHRPIFPGISVGSLLTTAGTLGCFVEKDGMVRVLSNWHILVGGPEGVLGQQIVQPGPVDGGSVPEDEIGVLTGFVPIQFGDGGGSLPSCKVAGAVTSVLNWAAGLVGSATRVSAGRPLADDPVNYCDAALCSVHPDVDYSVLVPGIGTPTETGEVKLGTGLQRRSRTTGYTAWDVIGVQADVVVDYEEGRTARFADQIIAGPMSEGGDSGSAVFDNEGRLVGLLFAGSPVTTIISPIQHVFEKLECSL